MAGGWDAMLIKNGEHAGLWGLLSRNIPARWAADDYGVTLTFPTKAEAEKGRREREREIQGLPRTRSDVFADKALRKRLTGRRGRPIIEVSEGPKGGT